MKTIQLFCFILFTGLSYNLTAQIVITGKITDAETSLPIVGATVTVPETNIGVASDLDGAYVIEVPDGYKAIRFSYLGYQSQEIVFGERDEIDIALKQDALQLTDIIVTVSKRLETAQSVPQSISVLSSKDLQRLGAFEAEDYFSYVPNLSQTVSGAGGAGFGDGRSSGKNIAIRGVSGTNTTVMYLDETPLPEFTDPKLFDVSRVEVLRGPQGTLYGSSTMGGAIKVVTNNPNVNKTEGSIEGNFASVTEGDFDYNARGIINVPLVKEKVALRVGGFYGFKTGIYDRRRQTHFNGFPLNNSDGSQFDENQIILDPNTGENIPYSDAPIELTLLDTPLRDDAWADGEMERNNVDDETSYGINAAIGIYPTENIKIIPRVIIQNTTGNGYDFADINPDNFIQYRTAGLDESYELDLTHYSLLSEFKFGAGELVNSLSYSQVRQADIEDVSEVQSSGGGGSTSGPPFGMRGGNVFPETIERFGDYSRLVEELRFLSDFDGAFNFTTGIFVSIESSKFDVTDNRALFLDIIGITDTDLFYFQDTDIDTDEYAFFGELYYNITKDLRFTAGFRFFQAQQEFSQLIGGLVGDFNTDPIIANTNESGFNPKLNLTYNFNKNTLIYASVSKGFRLGGGNPYVPLLYAEDDLAALGLSEAPATFAADDIWSYEIGSKNALADNRIIINAAVFHNIWNDLQQRVFLPSGFLFLDNVGAATITGMEADIRGKVTKNLQVGASVGILDAKISEGSDYTNSEAGDRILNVPEFTASGSIEYSHKIGNENEKSMYYRVDFQHTGERLNTFDPENQPEFVFDAFTLINARIGYSTPKYEIALFGTNITNTIANFGDVTSLGSTPFGRRRYATSRPATYGVSLRYNFSN